AHAGHVDVGREPPGPGGGADPDRVVADGAPRVAGDAAGHDIGQTGEARSHLEELGLAAEGRGDQLHDVAEAAALERRRQAGQPPTSRRTIRVPSTIAPSLAKATSRGRWRSPQSGLTARRAAGTTSRPARIRSATMPGVSTSWRFTSMTPRPRVNG